MELLAIKNYKEANIIFGNKYLLISSKMPCKCNDCFDVGIRTKTVLYNNIPGPAEIGSPIQCLDCNTIYPFDGIWWIRKNHFGEISSEDEHSTYEKTKELELIEK